MCQIYKFSDPFLFFRLRNLYFLKRPERTEVPVLFVNDRVALRRFLRLFRGPGADPALQQLKLAGAHELDAHLDQLAGGRHLGGPDLPDDQALIGFSGNHRGPGFSTLDHALAAAKIEAGLLFSAAVADGAPKKENRGNLVFCDFSRHGRAFGTVSYTHLTLPTNREV